MNGITMFELVVGMTLGLWKPFSKGHALPRVCGGGCCGFC